tara:strand:+ start:3168 stop:3701 length:534 start_codon:yes stop_codon:yes gene_type:complete
MSIDKTILAVDLDNTLIKTDMIFVGLKSLFFKKLYLFPKLLLLLTFKGKTYAKKFLYDNTQFSVTNIPFNNTVIDFIKLNKKHYISTILISGSYYEYVDYIADYLKIFDYRVGTTLGNNMISMNKVKYIRDKFGNTAFDYIGDSTKDIPIWLEARKAYVVNSERIKKKLKNIDYISI